MKGLGLTAVLALTMLPGAVLARHKNDNKPAETQGSNDSIQIVAHALTTKEEIRQAVGADLPEDMVVLKATVTPKGDKPLDVWLDDFKLVSHKDGQQSAPLAPSQIAGKAVLVVSTGVQGGGIAAEQGGPVWGGMGGGMPRRMPGNEGGIGNAGGVSSAEGHVESSDKDADNPLLTLLKKKILPEKTTKQAISGLLIFPIEGKVKGKDLALIYAGQAGRMVMEFTDK